MSTATLPQNNTLVAEALRKVTNISTLPEVTAKIVATVEDPKSTAASLHKIVAHDPALATRILKVVNSAFYGSDPGSGTFGASTSPRRAT